MTKTIIVGAGVAGLATAALLAREGHDVTVLERQARIGGRAGTSEHKGFRFDTGPSWYLMPRVFDHFFEMLGTTTDEQLDLRLLDPGYKVFSEPQYDGSVSSVTIPQGAENVLEVFERIEPGSSIVLQNYLKSASNASHMAEKYFLYNPFTKLSSLVQPDVIRSVPQLVRLLTETLRAYIAKRFQHPILRQILGYPAVFLGTDPRRAPSMYHLMSALDLDEGVQYPMGGFWQLVERFADLATQNGAQIITQANVNEILTERQGKEIRATGVRWQDADGKEHTLDADIVVSCADLHHTETRLLAPSARSYPETWWKKIESGPGAVIVLLGVEGSLPELEHHSLFFTKNWDTNFDAIFGKEPYIPETVSLYVCKPSATDSSVAPNETENLFLLIPIAPDVSVGSGGVEGSGDATVEAIAERAIAQIAQWANIPDLSQRIVVRETIGPADFAREYSSWSGGMLGPSHILKQSAMFRPQNKSKRVKNLYYAGATTAPGVGVPMCLISAEIVLKRIRGDHSAGPVDVATMNNSVMS